MNKYQKQALKETLVAFGMMTALLSVFAALSVASVCVFGTVFPATMALGFVGIMVMFYRVSVYEAMRKDASKQGKRKRKT